MIYKEKNETVRAWVNGFTVIPVPVAAKLMAYSYNCDFREIVLNGKSDDENKFPVWNSLWAFTDRSDQAWAESDDGLNAIAKCGFRIYESEDFGIVLGIDEPGYDFYESHWIPLFGERKLCRHEER